MTDWVAWRDDVYYGLKEGRPSRRWVLRQAMCGAGLHWPIRWSDSAYPGSYDPPEPPEPGFACEWCGHERDPYRAWWWNLKYQAAVRVERWRNKRQRKKAA